jgi:hypothetical protein
VGERLDRQDPTKTTNKFISMKVRPSLIPILIDFLSKRSMKIKFNQKHAGPFKLVGGSPQGSLIGQTAYTTGSHDNTDPINISEEDEYQYIDDLNLLELIFLTDVLIQYNFTEHVASDIGINQRFLPPSITQTQTYNEGIALWTHQNLAKLNSAKSSYMVHTRMKEDFATRFTLDNSHIGRKDTIKVLGVWLGVDPSCWDKNTKEIVKRCYASMSLLTKLKYAGLSRKKLINIYCLFIRSSAEYCSVVWHENLTVAQSNAIERIQVVALKIITGKDCPRKEDGHCDYEALLGLCQLTSLSDRRNDRMLSFGKKCIKHPTLNRIFPLNTEDINNVRNHDVFQVNHARTSAYQNSAIPAIQRRLNQHYSSSYPPV